jgi:hypothetical protein
MDRADSEAPTPVLEHSREYQSIESSSSPTIDTVIMLSVLVQSPATMATAIMALALVNC